MMMMTSSISLFILQSELSFRVHVLNKNLSWLNIGVILGALKEIDSENIYPGFRLDVVLLLCFIQ